jgi:hypothetical protein
MKQNGVIFIRSDVQGKIGGGAWPSLAKIKLNLQLS